MSFFIKGKSGKSDKRKYATNKKFQKPAAKKKSLKSKVTPLDKTDTISSDEEYENNDVSEQSSEEENETVQEKKLRLAKVYLEEIEKEERKRRVNAHSGSEDEDFVSKRLKVDYLKQVGKFKQSVADQYTGVDIPNIQVLRCKDHRSAITCLCVSLDNETIFSGSKDGSVVKWSLSNYKKLASIPFVKNTPTAKTILGHSNQIMSIAVSSDNKFLVISDTSKDIQVWNAQDLKHIGTLKGHRATVTGVVIRQNSHSLYSCSKDRSVKVWSLDEMSYIETLYGHQDGITAITALSRERAVTSGGRDCTVRIWKIAEESQLIFNGHSGSIDIVRLINEENFISGGDDGQICIWSSMKKKPLCSVKDAHGVCPVTSNPLWVTAVASLLNTDLVASGSSDGCIRVWKLGENFRSLQPLFTIEIVGFINDLSFTVDGKYLVAGVGTEHRLGRWNIIKNAKNSIVVIPLQRSL